MQNEEADALTNGEFHHFDPSFRIPVDLDKLEFVVLNELFREGDSYVSELAELKAAELEKKRSATTSSSAASKKKKGGSLRERDPW